MAFYNANSGTSSSSWAANRFETQFCSVPTCEDVPLPTKFRGTQPQNQEAPRMDQVQSGVGRDCPVREQAPMYWPPASSTQPPTIANQQFDWVAPWRNQRSLDDAHSFEANFAQTNGRARDWDFQNEAEALRILDPQPSFFHARETEDNSSGVGQPLPSSVNGVPVTTLMVRHVPFRLPAERLLQKWPRSEYKYDLLHVPFNLKDNRAAKLAIVNFATHQHAVAFHSKWHGRMIPSTSTRGSSVNRPIEVVVAARQGVVANVTHWSTTLKNFTDDSLLPVIFHGNRRCRFWDYAFELEQLRDMRSGVTISL